MRNDERAPMRNFCGLCDLSRTMGQLNGPGGLLIDLSNPKETQYDI